MKSPLLHLVLAAAIAHPLTAAPAAPRPNILYFYVDDMGWGSIGPNGQAARRAKNLPSVLTPNIDRLAAEGVNFSRGYGCHVCSPARSSQQTGYHQGHTFADNNDPDNARKAIRADDLTMGDALSGAGYATGYWGKWGYGGSSSKDDPVIQNIQTLPTSHGYSQVLAELHHVRAHTFFQPTLWHAPAKPGATGGVELVPNSIAAYANNRSYPDSPAFQNHPDYPKNGYCDDMYAFAALDFVRAGAKHYNATGQPFFGLLATQIPHAPFDDIAKLPEWNKAYRDDPHFASLPRQAQQWAAMVTRIDAHFGNILAALEDPDNDGDTSDSVAANTLVIFQSDNGGPNGDSNTVFDANGGLRGSKGQIQEGGIRVPLVMRWPAKITARSPLQAGTTSDRVVDVTDLLPTFCELAGADAPTGIDGVSLAATLSGSGHQRTREFIIHEAGNGQSIIRGKYKLVRTGSKEKPSSLALYDLAADRAEQHDLAAAMPDLTHELASLLLGERVTEPKGFANTYHHWTGKDGASTADAANWSAYEYINAGKTYLTDAGPPQLSWTTTMNNSSDKPRTARADADLAVLSLELGGKSRSAPQTLAIAPGITLTGRNEIRLAAHAILSVNQGTVSSLRWVDVRSGAMLKGSGTVDAHLYNAGTVSCAGPLAVNRDYREAAGSTLDLTLSAADTGLVVGREATLAGALAVTLAPGFTPAKGDVVKIISAKEVTGTFANPDQQVTAPGGTRFQIGYSATAVTLTAY